MCKSLEFTEDLVEEEANETILKEEEGDFKHLKKNMIS